jgi:uncharacterized protein involved in response to NO
VFNIVFHYWALRGRVDLALRDAYAAVGLILMFVAVIAGRIVPSFTMNAIRGFTFQRWKGVEALAVPLVIVTLVADALGAASPTVAVFAAATAVVHLIRLVGWRSWRVGARPILWILHVAYAWLPFGFALLALASFGIVAHSIAIHALTVGAIGCAIVGMITRTALGHTGRRLVAGRTEVAVYVLVLFAAAVRVCGPWLLPSASALWIDLAGGAWSIAFLLYLIKYAPYLSSPRVDGKAG